MQCGKCGEAVYDFTHPGNKKAGLPTGCKGNDSGYKIFLSGLPDRIPDLPVRRSPEPRW